jgi:hypothetical protein
VRFAVITAVFLKIPNFWNAVMFGKCLPVFHSVTLPSSPALSSLLGFYDPKRRRHYTPSKYQE